MQTPIDPQYQQFLGVLGDLSRLVVLSIVLERAFAFVFEHDWFLRLTCKEVQDPGSPGGVKRESKVPGLKGLIALATALWICFLYRFDILESLFPQVPTTNVAGSNLAVGNIGQIITAVVLAGGSAGAIAIFQGFLNMSKDSRDAAIAARKAEAQTAREVAELNAQEAVARRTEAENRVALAEATAKEAAARRARAEEELRAIDAGRSSSDGPGAPGVRHRPPDSRERARGSTDRDPTGSDSVQRAHDLLASAFPVPFTFVPDPVVQTTSSGITVVHFRQTVHGVDVFGHSVGVHVTPSGSLEIVGRPAAGDFGTPRAPTTSPVAAVQSALGALEGLADFPREGSAPRLLSQFPDPTKSSLVLDERLESPAQVRLCYWMPPDASQAVLAWEIHVVGKAELGEHALVISAEGQGSELLSHTSTVAHAAKATVWEFSPVESGSNGNPDRITVTFPLERASYPSLADRSFLPAHVEWVSNGITSGNNVQCLDTGSNRELSGVLKGADVVFELPDGMGVSQQVLNAFYLCNFLHDFFLFFGFDEASGNLQKTNFSGAGRAGDALLVSVLVHNPDKILAQTRSRPDGQQPRMKLGSHRSTGRAAALDGSVVVHEYAHAVVDRLVGGLKFLDPLAGKQQSEAMAEGYCDYFAMTILNHLRRRRNPSLEPSFVIGGWVANETTRGLRRLPYPQFKLGYGDVGKTDMKDPHDAGQVWGRVLLDVHETLEQFLGSRDAADELGWQLVVDSLKLIQPSQISPTFLDGRDALLKATINCTALSPDRASIVRNQFVEVFRRRGMGPKAQSPNASYSAIKASTE